MQRSAQAAAHGTGLDLPPDLLVPGDALWDGVSRDIGAALASDAPPEAKLAAIAKHLRDGVPGRPPAIPPDASAGDVAAVIGAQLALGGRPATAVFSGLLFREITLRPVGPGFMRGAEPAEAAALRLQPGDEFYVREGILMAGSIVCAKVTLKLAHQRVCQLTSGSTWGQIRTGTPAGTALGPHGLKPGHRTIEIIPEGNPAVRTWRVSTIRTVPVCIATEDVGQDLCRRLALGAS